MATLERGPSLTEHVEFLALARTNDGAAPVPGTRRAGGAALAWTRDHHVAGIAAPAATEPPQRRLRGRHRVGEG